MRVISGKLKGKKIEFLKLSSTRPLKDSVKENIFNIIIHSLKINIEINNANVLDLYSGVGSFGIECLSRGAKKVTFVEKNKNAFELLFRNVNQLSLTKSTKLINDSVQNIFNNLLRERYEIFFLDPPFMDKTFIDDLSIIFKKKFFKNNHIVIIHREKNSRDNFEELNIIFEKVYGRSKIIFGTFN